MRNTLLPDNLSPLLFAIEELVKKTFTIDLEISRLWDLEMVPDEFLPYLAWTLGVELWPREGLVSVAEKRELVRRYTEIRRTRGTKAALLSAYNAIGLDAEIIERPDGVQRLIRLVFKSDKKVITEELRSAVLRLTDLLKPVRVLYEIEVDIDLATTAAIPGSVSIVPLLDFYTVRGN